MNVTVSTVNWEEGLGTPTSSWRVRSTGDNLDLGLASTVAQSWGAEP